MDGIEQFRADKWFLKIQNEASEAVGDDSLEIQRIREAYRQAMDILRQFMPIGKYFRVLQEKGYEAEIDFCELRLGHGSAGNVSAKPYEYSYQGETYTLLARRPVASSNLNNFQGNLNVPQVTPALRMKVQDADKLVTGLEINVIVYVTDQRESGQEIAIAVSESGRTELVESPEKGKEHALNLISDYVLDVEKRKQLEISTREWAEVLEATVVGLIGSSNDELFSNDEDQGEDNSPELTWRD